MRIIGEAINTGERGTDSRMFPLQKLLCELGASLPGVLDMCISLVSISQKKMTVRSSEHAADNVNNQKKIKAKSKHARVCITYIRFIRILNSVSGISLDNPCWHQHSSCYR